MSVNGVVQKGPEQATDVQGHHDRPIAGAAHSGPPEKRSPVEGETQHCLRLQFPPLPPYCHPIAIYCHPIAITIAISTFWHGPMQVCVGSAPPPYLF